MQMINMDLFSELRTIYETTLLDPHTYRITIKMKDIIDGKLLREAVDMTMERYPYFRVCLYIKGDAIGFEENLAEVPVIHTKKRIYLGGEQSSGHLLAFCYWKNKLFIDAYHGLSDGGGIYPLIRTLLFYYCSSFYGKELSAEGVRLRGHVPLTIEMSALHGYFFINFIQYFDEYDYFSTFLDQLRQNDIDYDVLNVAEARYPRVELPQWNL